MHIALEAVGFRFAPAHPWLFRGLTETILPGRLWGLSGPSGSGKSTLLSLLSGSVMPTEGRMLRGGVDSTFWIFQTAAGMPRRSALDHVVLPLMIKGATRTDAEIEADRYLDRVGLLGARTSQLGELSGGETQRLMLARALAHGAPCLFVDEPTAQLDRANASSVIQVLSELRRDDRIVVIASHDRLLLDVCDEQIVLGAV